MAGHFYFYFFRCNVIFYFNSNKPNSNLPRWYMCIYIYIYIKTKISLQETLEKFNKKKSKKITVNDLQHEIRNIK